MDATVTITGTCAGGNHVFVEVTRGGRTKNVVIERNDLMVPEEDDFGVRTEEQAVCKELRRLVKREGLKTFAELKNRSTDLPVIL
jgi:hypothetical protein